MRKQIAFATAIIFAIAVTIPSAAVVAQQQINTNTSSQSTNSSSSSNPLSLNTIFKQTENSVVQITSKAPTTGVANPLNQSSSNATTLGSGFVYDKQGHIVTNAHVIGDAKVVDLTFPDGNRYTAKVIASDLYSDTAVLQISQNASQPLLQQLLSLSNH